MASARRDLPIPGSPEISTAAAFASFRLRPPAYQKLDLLVSTNQRVVAVRSASNRLSTPLARNAAQDSYRFGNALEFSSPEVVKLE